MSRGKPASLSVVLHVIDILDELHVRYHLGGSFASAIHGVPRQTMDADLVVDLEPGTVVGLIDRLRDRFYVDLDVAKDAVARHGSFNAIHLESGFKIDFFIKGTGEFDEVELERSKPTADRSSSVEIRHGQDGRKTPSSASSSGIAAAARFPTGSGETSSVCSRP